MWKVASHRVKEWLKYQKQSKTKYYLHSPFVFEFHTKVLEANFLGLNNIEAQRKNYLANKFAVVIEDKGAKSGVYTTSVSYLAKNASTPHYYGKILHAWIKQHNPHYIIELGTSLGFGTAYMAAAKPDLDIVTIDASAAVQSYAMQLHADLGFKNITYVNDNFDSALPNLLLDMPRIDFVYIDGNHTEEATLRYFDLLKPNCNENSVLVFDDIYWSEGMTNAWNKIKADQSVSLTIDLYRMGWVFFRKEKIAKENFVLRY